MRWTSLLTCAPRWRDSLNEIHVTSESEELLVDTYAEMLCAYFNLVRPGMANSVSG
jgi:hypothetical protein